MNNNKEATEPRGNIGEMGHSSGEGGRSQFSPRTESLSTATLATGAASSSSSPCPCQIKRDGAPIVPLSANYYAQPGQQINLSLSCTGATPTNITWSIPDKSFKDYSMATNAAVLTLLADTDLHSTLITFYWADAGQKTVSVSFKLGERDCTLDVILGVTRPLCDFTADVRGTIIQKGTILVLEGDNNLSGILFKAKVYYEGFPQGTFGFVRTVLDDWVTKQQSVSGCTVSKYQGERVADGSQPKSQASTGTNPQMTELSGGDSPGVAYIDSTID